MKSFAQIQKRNLQIEYPASPILDKWTEPDKTKFAVQNEEYRHPQGDFLKDGFAPAGMDNTDFSIIHNNGLFHLYGVGGYKDCFPNWHGQYEHIFHASTPNLIDWTVHGKALTPHPDNKYENNKVWPPFVFKTHNGNFGMIYCGLDYDNCQCLCLAFSDDLFEWRRFGHNPIVAPEKLSWTLKRQDGKVRHCRDPHIEIIDGIYYLYYSTICADGNPAVGLSASIDLLEWEDLGPCFKRTNGWIPESPLVIQRDGKYFLWIHAFTDDFYVSDDPANFHSAEKVPVTGINLMAPEIIDRRYKDKYLIGFYGYKRRRISLGIMNWLENGIKIDPITNSSELAPWE